MILFKKQKENNKIIFLFKIDKDINKKIIKKILNKKVIKINDDLKIDKIKKLKEKNNIILIKKKNTKLFYIKKYLKISDEIYIEINSEINKMGKNYLLLEKLENNLKINKNNIIIVIKKNIKKNEIYFLILREIFKKYKVKII